MFTRVKISFAMSLCAICLCGCGGQLYNVAPLPSRAPDNVTTDSAAGFNISATAIDGDQSLERFEANLPLAGVIVVEVRLANRTQAAINAASLRFELRDAGGRSFRAIAPKKALKQVMNYYGDSFYRIDARQNTIDSYQAMALPLGSAIAPQEERRGLLFFEAPRNTTKFDGLTLSAAGAKPPISVKIN